jgi:uncharacterized SAM-binding protein YcdF (DUF218 family)
MFFVLSKIFWVLVNPGNLLLLLISIGTVLLWTRWRRFGRRLVGFTVVAFLVLAVVPLGTWAFGNLEDRFPPLVQLPEKVDGIIVAGGIVDPVTSKDRGQLSINGAVERVYEMAVLSRRFPKARLVFSGGSGSLLYQEHKEASAVAPLLRQLGVDLGRVIFEDQSRNTSENAVYSYRIVQPKKGETWLLITSAFHMPRTVGSFRQVGWDVTPYPVDYHTRKTKTLPLQFNFSGGMGSLGGAVHEFLGLLFYWLDGKTDELFPGPR